MIEALKKLRWSLRRSTLIGMTHAGVGHDFKPQGWLTIDRIPTSSVCIGGEAALVSFARRIVVGVSNAVILRTLRHPAQITIGDRRDTTRASICGTYPVSIGTGISISSNALIVERDPHPIASGERQYSRVPKPDPSCAGILGDSMFVRANALTLKGVQMGADSAVGAGAAIAALFPENSVSVGNSVRIIRHLDIKVD